MCHMLPAAFQLMLNSAELHNFCFKGQERVNEKVTIPNGSFEK